MRSYIRSSFSQNKISSSPNQRSKDGRDLGPVASHVEECVVDTSKAVAGIEGLRGITETLEGEHPVDIWDGERLNQETRRRRKRTDKEEKELNGVDELPDEHADGLLLDGVPHVDALGSLKEKGNVVDDRVDEDLGHTHEDEQGEVRSGGLVGEIPDLHWVGRQ